MQYAYRRTEVPRLKGGGMEIVWTVGHYDENRQWHPRSDHETPSEAAKVMCELNDWIPRPRSLEDKAKEAARLVNEFSHDHTAMEVFGSLISQDTGLHAAHLVEQEEARRSTAADYDDEDDTYGDDLNLPHTY